MKECSKSVQRRLHDPNFSNRYFVGDGVDIGGKPDPLSLYSELFPRIRSIRIWDWEDGDAQHMAGAGDGSFDFVHSSHCLEHLVEPREGLKNWFRVLKPGGHLIVTVPDEDLYEQGVFPSTFNRDHKWTFTIHKQHSWSPKSLNVVDLVLMLGDAAHVAKIELLTATHRANLPRFDQTLTPVGESAIEFIVRKRLPRELERLGLSQRPEQASRELLVYLNQYRDDHNALKAAAREQPPFKNDKDLT